MTKPESLPIAAWKVTLDGLDLTPRLKPRLLSLSITEKRGESADQLDLALDDSDGRLAIPRRGAVLRVHMGWLQGTGLPLGLVDKGGFMVDEIGGGGPPDTVTLRARSADFTDAFRVRRSRSFVAQPLGDILATLAADNGLVAHVSSDLASKVVPALGHSAQSDAALLAQFGRRYDATATIKAGALIFAPAGAGRTAKSTPIPTETIDRRDVATLTWSTEGRDQYDGVAAVWYDTATATQHTITVGHTGAGKPRRLRRTYHSAADAQAAAAAQNTRGGRGLWKMDLTLSLGRPDLYPDRPITLTGFKAELNAQTWLIDEARHTMDGSGGLITKITANG